MWRSEQVTEWISEVVPLNDSREHWSLDECWCNPRKEHVKYTESGLPVNIECRDGFTRGALLFVHNANDGREKYEREPSNALS